MLLTLMNRQGGTRLEKYMTSNRSMDDARIQSEKGTIHQQIEKLMQLSQTFAQYWYRG